MGSPTTEHEPRQQRRLNRGAARVLTYLDGQDRPLAAQQLWTSMRETGDRMGLATVCRALHALAAAGLVHQFHHDTQTTYRACGPGRHDHLVCRTCGRVQERRTVWERPPALPADFTADESVVDIYGRCGVCS